MSLMIRSESNLRIASAANAVCVAVSWSFVQVAHVFAFPSETMPYRAVVANSSSQIREIFKAASVTA
jgi:hypothetical protein